MARAPEDISAFQFGLRESWSRTTVTAIRRSGTHKCATSRGRSAQETNYAQAQYLATLLAGSADQVPIYMCGISGPIALAISSPGCVRSAR
jgi:hypothetical protein